MMDRIAYPSSSRFGCGHCGQAIAKIGPATHVHRGTGRRECGPQHLATPVDGASCTPPTPETSPA